MSNLSSIWFNEPDFFSRDLNYTKYVGNLSEEAVIGIPGAMHHLFIDEPIVFVEEIKKLLKK